MSKKRIHIDTLHGILASCLIFFPILNFRRSAGNAGPVSKKILDTPNFRHYPDTFGENVKILDAFRHSLLSSRVIKVFNMWQRAICFSAGVGPNMAPRQNSDRPDDRRRRACRQRRRKKNHLIEAAPFGRLDQM